MSELSNLRDRALACILGRLFALKLQSNIYKWVYLICKFPLVYPFILLQFWQPYLHIYARLLHALYSPLS